MRHTNSNRDSWTIALYMRYDWTLCCNTVAHAPRRGNIQSQTNRMNATHYRRHTGMRTCNGTTNRRDIEPAKQPNQMLSLYSMCRLSIECDGFLCVPSALAYFILGNCLSHSVYRCAYLCVNTIYARPPQTLCSARYLQLTASTNFLFSLDLCVVRICVVMNRFSTQYIENTRARVLTHTRSLWRDAVAVVYTIQLSLLTENSEA